ncbi:armadillo-type protein [Lineolata rhizophorae]|uniref:Armadillo-type protein n=1 Tax=Lineolata rhizophorae TaxID=578093 RepID=A0A6A6P826_9PEZI|nr:armadillo-type protein [Lineolata rhizophorae]
MDGMASSPGAFDQYTSPANGYSSPPPAAAPFPNSPDTNADLSPDLAQIPAALTAVHDPRSTNETRRAASAYLEQAKRHPSAPQYGFSLAAAKQSPGHLRLYGLSMIEHAVSYGWDEFGPGERAQLRAWTVQLATSVDTGDAFFLRNKIAVVWAEVAKRCWPGDWDSMDEILVRGLWEAGDRNINGGATGGTDEGAQNGAGGSEGGGSAEKRTLVMVVLETLAEDVFNRDDPVAALRNNELGRACVEIFTPQQAMMEDFPQRESAASQLGTEVRYGTEGWVKRLCDVLEWCLASIAMQNQGCGEARGLAIRVLGTLKAVFPWIIPKALQLTGCIQAICKAVTVPDVPLQMAAVEALYAIYSRPHLHDDEFVDIVAPLYFADSVGPLHQLYTWSAAPCIEEVEAFADDGRYDLCKKIAELLAHLANCLEQRPQLVPDGNDIPGFLALLFDVLKSESLLVSIPVLHAWTRLLRCRVVRDSDTVNALIGGLMEVCAARLVRYEYLPEDSDNATFRFLSYDIDTIPERHAFLGNYRRYCVDVVQVIVWKLPREAVQHTLGQAEELFRELYAGGGEKFQPENYNKNSMSVLRADAQIAGIDAALRGYLKWEHSLEGDPESERTKNDLHDIFENWCRTILTIQFMDPEIIKRIISLIVTISTKALSTRPSLAISILEYIVSLPDLDAPGMPAYADSVKSLEQCCHTELQRLAMAFPDQLLSVYDELEAKVNTLLAKPSVAERRRHGFIAFLFLIVHRSTTLDREVQEARLREMIRPVREAWQDPEFGKSLQSFQGFCELLGLGQLPEFLMLRGFHQIEDWSSKQLDPEGRVLQEEIMSRQQRLPLRLTRALLSASTEKVQEGTQAYELTCTLWADTIRDVLPNLLQLIRYAQAFNDPETWQQLPVNLREGVIKRMLTDRFWQAGISKESRDDFFARVSGSKDAYEGFASTVRGSARQVRDSSYYVIFTLVKLRDFFYGIPDLPRPLAEALYTHAAALSSHHLSVLLSMSTHLIDGCPPHLRAHFLPPLVEMLFAQLDRKIPGEWDRLSGQLQLEEASREEELGDEMKSESILRQLTYTAVSLLTSLMASNKQGIENPQSASENSGGQQDANSKNTDTNNNPKPEPLWKFVEATPSILERLFVFAKNMLRVRDTRSVGVVIRGLRATIPTYRAPGPIHNFICYDILQAAITSLHEPYFVDIQRDLAGLIATIVRLDAAAPAAGGKSDGGAVQAPIAREVLLSLPGMAEAPRARKLDRAIEALAAHPAPQDRQQRALVLDLLASVRGVSIHELGKVQRPEGRKRSAAAERYMNVDQEGVGESGGRGASGKGGVGEGEEALAGVADMFG